jgi:hypothetical protein
MTGGSIPCAFFAACASAFSSDRFRCRGCGAGSRLLVHRRTGNSEEGTLITLCIRCHIRVHRCRRLRHWVPSALIQLWAELHAGAPLQLQLPLAAAIGAAAQASNRDPAKALAPVRDFPRRAVDGGRLER